jgi:hypothetical protein
MTRKPLSDGSRYYASLVMPRKISQGRVLAHNRVRHTVDMPNGRAFAVGRGHKATCHATSNAANADGRVCSTIGCASSRHARTRKVIAASRRPS